MKIFSTAVFFFFCMISPQTNAKLKKCQKEETIKCPENYHDGCLVKNWKEESLTTHHVCVKNNTEKNTSLKCRRILPLFQCNQPEVFSCTNKPPVSDWKLCFRMPITNNPP